MKEIKDKLKVTNFISCLVFGWVVADVALGRMNSITPFIVLGGLAIITFVLTSIIMDGDL